MKNKTEKFGKSIKEKLVSTENDPIKGLNWSKENSWNKLEEKMNEKSYKLPNWIYFAAASIFIIVLSNLLQFRTLKQQKITISNLQSKLNVVISENIDKKDLVNKQKDKIQKINLLNINLLKSLNALDTSTTKERQVIYSHDTFIKYEYITIKAIKDSTDLPVSNQVIASNSKKEDSIKSYASVSTTVIEFRDNEFNKEFTKKKKERIKFKIFDPRPFLRSTYSSEVETFSLRIEL